MSAKISRRAIAKVVTNQLLAKDADSHAIMKSLAAYLVERNMTEHADVIMNDIADELMRQAELLSVEVTSARPLEPSAREQLIAYLKSATGASRVSMHESTDETLLGGLIARTAAGELDTSIRTKLRQLTALA